MNSDERSTYLSPEKVKRIYEQDAENNRVIADLKARLKAAEGALLTVKEATNSNNESGVKYCAQMDNYYPAAGGKGLGYYFYAAMCEVRNALRACDLSKPWPEEK